ncbi:MAG TPA: helix-turn-helix transcriptional regulator [Drouetiella sp.]
MLKRHEPDLIKALGNSIAERRRYIAMTQQQLADAVGVHRTYLSEIEQGKRNLSVGTLYQIAACLEISADKLLKQADLQSRVQTPNTKLKSQK